MIGRARHTHKMNNFNILPPQNLAELANNIRWLHRIHLGDGHFTPGSQDLALQTKLWHIPEDLTGKTVLDIGCNDGGFSLIALERGASRVVAIDAFTTPGFHFIRKHLPLAKKIEYANIDLLGETFLELPQFHFVLFTGVLYHLKNPLAGLIRLRHVTRGVVLIETLVDERIKDLPSMVFYENAEIDHNKTNWWGPNLSCFQAMVRSAGFTRLEIVHHQIDEQTQLGRSAILAYVDYDASYQFNLGTIWTINPDKYKK